MAIIPKICDFFECNEFICKADKRLKQSGSLRFCQQHSNEINSYFKEWDIPKSLSLIMDFWVRSRGGAKRMAKGIDL